MKKIYVIPGRLHSNRFFQGTMPLVGAGHKVKSSVSSRIGVHVLACRFVGG